MTLINLLIIQLLIVFVIDLSGFIEELEKMIAKWLKVNKVHIPKPFSCSLCSTWWTGIIYLIIIGHFTLPYIGFVALLAYLTPVAYNFLIMVKEALTKITNINI